MAYNTRSAGFWESLRRLPERTPLRVKLITAVLALVAVALLVMSVAGLSFLRTYLLGQADAQLTSLEPSSALQHTGQAVPGPEGWIQIFLVNGQTSNVITLGYDLPGGSGSGPQITPGASWLTSGAAVTVPAQTGTGKWRVQAVPNQQLRNGTSGTLVAAVDVTSQYSTLAKLTTVDAVVSVLILIALVAIGAAIIQASLKPLNDIEQTAGAIAAGDLTRRVPERDPRTEVGRLGRSLNVMLSQIETAFHARSRSEAAARRSEEKMRQFVADASHELRTPLTAIRGFAEYYRQRGGVGPPDAEGGAPVPAGTEAWPGASYGTVRNGAGKLAPADLDRIMRRVEQESARMGVLVEDMLLLARLDQQRPLQRGPVDLLTLAADAVHDARVVAPNRTINLTVGKGAALLVVGDEVRLRQVIGNLMSNALVHTPDRTPIDVHIRPGSMAEIHAWNRGGADAEPAVGRGGVAAQSAAVLEVADHGPGLSEEQAAHVFERFYRADQARTAGGTGLGLAIVTALVAAHGGAVWVTSRPGHGATFSIALPLAPEAVQEAGHGDDPGAEPDPVQEAGPAGPAAGSPT
jgi:two-component system, OmpR family, sensor kinase